MTNPLILADAAYIKTQYDAAVEAGDTASAANLWARYCQDIRLGMADMPEIAVMAVVQEADRAFADVEWHTAQYRAQRVRRCPSWGARTRLAMVQAR